MPASFSPAPPNSMASLSIEEGAAPSPAALDTATTTVPVISADKKDDSELGAGSSSSMGGTEGEKYMSLMQEESGTNRLHLPLWRSLLFHTQI